MKWEGCIDCGGGGGGFRISVKLMKNFLVENFLSGHCEPSMHCVPSLTHPKLVPRGTNLIKGYKLSKGGSDSGRAAWNACLTPHPPSMTNYEEVIGER